MANNSAIITEIQNTIKQNGVGAIKGNDLQQVLVDMVHAVGQGRAFAGIATPSGTPSTYDRNVFWLATAAGTYTNFGGLVIPEGLSVILYNEVEGVGSYSFNTLFKIDDEPTSESGNLVLSGAIHAAIQTAIQAVEQGATEIYDVSGNHSGASYSTLAAALALVPQVLQKGGISVKYIDSTSGKYVQYRLLATSWSNNASDWEKVGLLYNGTGSNTDGAMTQKAVTDIVYEYAGQFTDNPEWMYVILDSNRKVLAGIKRNGEVQWGIGIPNPVRRYIDSNISKIVDGTESTDVDGLDKIIAFLAGFTTSDVLRDLIGSKADTADVYQKEQVYTKDEANALLSQKVNTEEGKGLVDTDFASSSSAIDNEEFLKIITDSNGRILVGIRQDKSILWNLRIPEPFKKYFTTLDETKETIAQSSIIKANAYTPNARCEELLSTYDAKKITVPSYGNTDTSYMIVVNQQSDFTKSGILTKIQQGIGLGYSSFTIVLAAPFLYYEEGIFDYENENVSNIRISIVGDNTKLMSGGEDYSIDDNGVTIVGGYYKLPYTSPYTGETDLNQKVTFFDVDSHEQVNPVSEIHYVEGLAETYDSENSIVRMKIDSSYELDNDCPSYIFISRLYARLTRKLLPVPVQEEGDGVQTIKDGYVYFEDELLSNGRWLANSDYYSSISEHPKYCLFGASEVSCIHVRGGYIYIPVRYKKVHECRVCNFAKVTDNLASFNIEGCEFIGNCASMTIGKDGTGGGDSGVIDISNYDNENGYVSIHNCVFREIRVCHITIHGTAGESVCQNISIKDNTFEDYNYYAIKVDNAHSVFITNNKFFRAGRYIQNGGCVSTSRCDNTLVSHNYFEDINGTSVSSGEWYGFHKNGVSPVTEVICEHNYITYTDMYNRMNFMNAIGDNGSIYAYLNKEFIIRYNVIEDRTQNKLLNSGIYCDDGAAGLRIYGNLLINSSSNNYDIWLRRVAPSNVPDVDGEPSDVSNTDNVVFYNFITGCYKVEGRNEEGVDDECFNGCNFIFGTNKYNGREADVIDVQDKEDDYYFYNSVLGRGYIRIPNVYKSFIGSVNIDKRIKSKILTNIF